jgi:hypothetical protein
MRSWRRRPTQRAREGQFPDATRRSCSRGRAGIRVRAADTLALDDERQLRTGHGMRPPLPVRADGAGVDRARDLIRASGRSSTALLLDRQRSHAVGADCPFEDHRNRTLESSADRPHAPATQWSVVRYRSTPQAVTPPPWPRCMQSEHVIAPRSVSVAGVPERHPHTPEPSVSGLMASSNAAVDGRFRSRYVRVKSQSGRHPTASRNFDAPAGLERLCTRV